MGNELVIDGLVTSSVPVVLREGRVIFRSGGTGYSTLNVTNTALVGATNGIATSATVALGISAAGTLNLNGFDQTLAGLQLGSGAFNGTAALGANTLTLAGNVSTANTGTHNITGTGTLALGANNASFTVVDGNAPNGLTIAPKISRDCGIQ